MAIKNYYDKNCTYVDSNGNQLTEDEIEFLNLMKNIEEQYGTSVLLAIRVIMEAVSNKGKEH